MPHIRPECCFQAKERHGLPSTPSKPKAVGRRHAVSGTSSCGSRQTAQNASLLLRGQGPHGRWAAARRPETAASHSARGAYPPPLGDNPVSGRAVRPAAERRRSRPLRGGMRGPARPTKRPKTERDPTLLQGDTQRRKPLGSLVVSGPAQPPEPRPGPRLVTPSCLPSPRLGPAVLHRSSRRSRAVTPAGELQTTCVGRPRLASPRPV